MMSTLTFDTLKFAKQLKEAGLPEKQAEAISEAFKDAQAEIDVATKQDIELLRRDMKELEQSMTIKLGSIMAISIGIVAVLVKLFS